MNKIDVKLCKEKIIKCLTEEFLYGTRKDGKPLKRRRINVPIFDSVKGFMVYTNTDLEMVMDKVILGLYFAMDEDKET